MASVIKGTFVSPSAEARNDAFQPQQVGFSAQIFSNLSWWTLVATFLLGLIVYDQSRGKLMNHRPPS